VHLQELFGKIARKYRFNFSLEANTKIFSLPSEQHVKLIRMSWTELQVGAQFKKIPKYSYNNE
jgi:hypothetical protein